MVFPNLDLFGKRFLFSNYFAVTTKNFGEQEQFFLWWLILC